jgi:peptide/nickel transport system substrate-binding protein
VVKKFIVTTVALVAIVGLVVGCGGPIEPPEPEERTTGPYPDSVLITEEPVSAAAITKLGLNELDVYAFSIADADLYAEALADPNIQTFTSVGSFNEITCNPVPYFTDGTFNPFGFRPIREALNMLFDRDYVVDEICGGLAIPKYTCLSGAFADAVDRYPHIIADIEAQYAYDPAAAEATITAEMEALGAYIDAGTGTWFHDGEELVISVLTRVEDERLQIGDYVGVQLESIGFKVINDYKTSAEAAPLWIFGDPADGLYHLYTGGWLTTMVVRDQGSNFAFYYTDMGIPYPLWMAYENTPEFYEVAGKLNINDFTSLAEREALFAEALPLSLEDSARIFLTDNTGFGPYRTNVQLACDAAAGIYGSQMWQHTIAFLDAAGNPTLGGQIRTAMPSMLPQPPNPIAGSNWVYDMHWIRGTADADFHPDVRDGLYWPGRVEKAEVTVQTGLPVGVSTGLGHGAWCSLSFEDSIEVPADAWADWNAVTQQFIPAGSGVTAMRKSVVYYPSDIFEIPLHDGSTLSMGDFLMKFILVFDRAKPESAMYDEAYVPDFDSFMSAFKGVKFITDDPSYGLIIETYSDLWYMDAEWAAASEYSWPYYAQGPGMWHTVGLGVRAESDNQLAYSADKAEGLGVEWTSFIAGPSLDILSNQLTLAQAANWIPYEPTMGMYVTAEEATERWANLAAWSAPAPEGKGHFWVASGPFYLEAAYPLTKVVQLTRFEDFPDETGRFDFMIID